MSFFTNAWKLAHTWTSPWKRVEKCSNRKPMAAILKNTINNLSRIWSIMWHSSEKQGWVLNNCRGNIKYCRGMSISYAILSRNFWKIHIHKYLPNQPWYKINWGVYLYFYSPIVYGGPFVPWVPYNLFLGLTSENVLSRCGLCVPSFTLYEKGNLFTYISLSAGQ